MGRKVTHLDRQQIAHLLRAASAITGHASFVLIGTGAVIAQAKDLPSDLMRTREIDIYASVTADTEPMSDLIDGSIGEGSPFDDTFGYYAHGISERTACLPDDWQSRAVRLAVPGAEGVFCVCPEVNDIALSKLCAWREKDVVWLSVGLTSGLLDLKAMRNRAGTIANPNAPAPDEMARRLEYLAQIAAGASDANFSPKG